MGKIDWAAAKVNEENFKAKQGDILEMLEWVFGLVTPESSNEEYNNWKRFQVGTSAAIINIRLDPYKNRIEVNAGSKGHLFNENKLRVEHKDIVFFTEFTLDFGRPMKDIASVIKKKTLGYVEQWQLLRDRAAVVNLALLERNQRVEKVCGDLSLSNHSFKGLGDYDDLKAWCRFESGASFDLVSRDGLRFELQLDYLSVEQVYKIHKVLSEG